MGDFRRGDEPADFIDRGFEVFVGDKRLRDQVVDDSINTINDLEDAANVLSIKDAHEMGIPHRPAPKLDDILAEYEREIE